LIFFCSFAAGGRKVILAYYIRPEAAFEFSMDGFWCIHSVLDKPNQLFVIERHKKMELMMRVRIESLWRSILTFNATQEDYWRVMREIEALEEEMENCKKRRLEMEKALD